MKLMIPLTFALTLGVAAPLAAQSGTETSYDENTVLAEVNDTKITLGHVVAMISRLPQQYQELPDGVLFSGILDQLIDQTALADHASAQEGFKGRAVELILENERRGLIASTLIEGQIAKPVEDAELQEAYDAQYATQEAEEEFNASHILVETEEEAKALIEALTAGGDFAELAKEKSTGPSGANGGNLGWFGKGQMVPAFEEAVLALEAGAVSAPVKTQFGWHVIQMVERRAKQAPPLAAVKTKLSDELKQARLEAFVSGVRDAATIKRVEINIPPEEIRNLGLIGRE